MYTLHPDSLQALTWESILFCIANLGQIGLTFKEPIKLLRIQIQLFSFLKNPVQSNVNGSRNKQCLNKQITALLTSIWDPSREVGTSKTRAAAWFCLFIRSFSLEFIVKYHKLPIYVFSSFNMDNVHPLLLNVLQGLINT